MSIAVVAVEAELPLAVPLLALFPEPEIGRTAPLPPPPPPPPQETRSTAKPKRTGRKHRPDIQPLFFNKPRKSKSSDAQGQCGREREVENRRLILGSGDIFEITSISCGTGEEIPDYLLQGM
ncbi:hypothetical protein [uncultured Pseudacidovorax sp.]|uniref:hypothetical protein n=1 Tax=uncultured Pseudacidovorax sp. TaxID=679313 RepID=UPI0025F05EB2|nr:hypothetical protein [uncultured Pseudacidovorax sp.]